MAFRSVFSRRTGRPGPLSGLAAGPGLARGLVVAVLAAAPALGQAPVRALTSGAVVDGELAGLVRASGAVQIAFTRSDFTGPVGSGGVYALRSVTGGQTFGTPSVVSNRPNERESLPTLLETPVGRVLYCYFVSDAGGTPKIRWANSSDGVFWNASPSALDFGLGAGTPLGKPAAAVLSATQGLLAFEDRSDGTVKVAILDGFITPRAPQTLGPGVDPTLLARADGTFVLAFRPDAASRSLQVVNSYDGISWSAETTVATASEPLAAPQLVETRRGSLSLAWGTRSGAGTGRIFRTAGWTPQAFTEAWELPLAADDATRPVLLADADSAPGLALYFSRVATDGSGESHVARTVTGACDLTPLFPGLLEVLAIDSCGLTGVQLEWMPPPSWGSAEGGEYEVHRGLPPAFEPGPDTLLGVTRYTWWFDDTVPPDTPHAYAVVATGAESCRWLEDGTVSGRAEGGAVQLVAAGSTPALPPGPVEGLVLMRRGESILARWDPTARAASYVLSVSPSTEWPSFSDVGPPSAAASVTVALPDGRLRFYLVRAIDACGVEGPAH